MCWIRRLCVAVLGLGLAGCGDLPNGPACCAIEEPTCDCFQIGGAEENGQCTAICDAEPDGWVTEVDEHGCEVLRFVGGTGSCFPPWSDAGTDAGGEADAGADAGAI